jgi:decaprenyl-phosphate phosphoribosyltransferase
VRRRSTASNLLRSIRPSQWTKNLLVFAGLIFGEKLGDAHSRLLAGLAFVVFCLLSSTVYLINDVRDREADRLHPAKSRRPIASGELSVAVATGTAVVLGAVALVLGFWINWSFGVVATTNHRLVSLY